MQTVREGSRQQTKGPAGNSALLQQPAHPRASSALPAAGTADRGLASITTQDAAALQKPWTKPLLGTTGIVFRDYALPTNTQMTFPLLRANLHKNNNHKNIFGYFLYAKSTLIDKLCSSKYSEI